MKDNVLGVNKEYISQTSLYEKKDAILALILYIMMFFLFILMGRCFVQKGKLLTETYMFCFTGIISLLCIGFVFAICSIRKQKLITVGFSKTYAKESLVTGAKILLIFVIIKGIIPIANGATIRLDSKQIIMKVIYYLIFISFMEEFVFRGFIGTRLFGFFRNKLLSIIVVGILFTGLHIPFQMIITHLSLLQYISINIVNLISIFFWHFIEQWLYAKYNSIIAPVMLHFSMDFIGWFIIF